jgi:ribosomal protein S18 acetylase RimI-like enzyme
MMLPAFRPYDPADLDLLVECWFDTWHATFFPRRHPLPMSAWRNRFLRDYAGRAEVWLLAAPGRILAFMVLKPQRRHGFIEQLFVHPQNQHQGLGRALLALARFRCPAGLELDTPAENLVAREFYRRQGFAAQKVAFDPLVERVILRYAWPALEARRRVP